MTPPLSSFDQRATVRLIPTKYYAPPVLDPLADTAEERGLLEELEGLTSNRLLAEREGLPDLDRRELAFTARRDALGRWGHSHVNAAFAYAREPGNRFNDARRGAWYCALDDLTAMEEVGYHRTRELRFIGVFEDAAVYQTLLADFIGDFPDLRAVSPRPPCLHPDPAQGYPAGQARAAALRAEGATGLIYPSVRRAGGVCFVAFAPQIVQNARPGARWRLRWTGAPEFTAETA